MRHLAGAALGAVVLALLATGCTPDPAPTPSPTGFASDEEAFAAAEATYRAYVDAVNARRADPESQPDPTSYLTGKALEVDLDGDRQLEAMGLRIEGPSAVTSVLPLSATRGHAEVLVCLDSSESRLLDEAGVNRTPTDRQDVIGLDVKILWSLKTPLISESTTSESSC